jgi:putative hydrolase of the HAD superfamily
VTARVLLFDLGGVLVDWRGLRELQRITGEDAAEVRRRFVASDVVRRYETGLCGRREFAEGFVAEWGLGLSPGDFLAAYADWLGSPYPDALACLDALRGRHRLACLSNTNELHWPLMMEGMGLASRFDARFASYLLQVAKPETAAFRLVLERLGVAPSQVVFFDDGRDNVEAAASLGIESHLVDPRHGVRPTLEHLGLLPPS